MREFIATPRDDGRKLVKWMQTVAPGLTEGLTRKFVRLKRVRINGKPAKDDAHVSSGDAIQLYINDEYFEARPHENKLLAGFHPRLDIIYEDANLLIVNKRPGIRVHPDDAEKVDTLITHIQAYLYKKNEYDGEGFAPALCNRIDRFTGGIVVAAKNRDALLEMDRRIRAREVRKFYLCALAGRLSPASGVLRGYIVKDGKRVHVQRFESPEAQYAETRYHTLSVNGDASLVECELVTGRTHQIRAQFAAIGHPLIGDTQYGDASINAAHASNFQQLYAYRIEFNFSSDAGCLEYLNGQSFQVARLHDGFEALSGARPGQ